MFKKIGFAAGTALIGASSFAAGPDLTALTSAVDFGTVITAVLMVAGALATVYVAVKGAIQVFGMLKRG